MKLTMGGCTALGTVPAPSRAWSRKHCCSVSANKLIKGANRPTTSKKGSGSKKNQNFELNLQRLCTDPEYVPNRQIGPVEVATKSGEEGKQL